MPLLAQFVQDETVAAAAFRAFHAPHTFESEVRRVHETARYAIDHYVAPDPGLLRKRFLLAQKAFHGARRVAS